MTVTSETTGGKRWLIWRFTLCFTWTGGVSLKTHTQNTHHSSGGNKFLAGNNRQRQRASALVTRCRVCLFFLSWAGFLRVFAALPGATLINANHKQIRLALTHHLSSSMLTTQVPSTEPPHIGDVPYGNLSWDLPVDACMCECFFFFFLQTVKMRRVTPGRGDRWNLNVQRKEKLTKGGLEPQMADKAYV